MRSKPGLAVVTSTWLIPGLIGGLLSSGVAQAEGQTTVAVLGVEASAGASPDLASQLTTALKSRVHRVPGFVLVQGKNLDEVKLVFGCVDEKPACMARVGRSLQAAKLLWGSLRPAGNAYALRLHYLDVASASLERSVNERLTQDEAARPSDAVARVTAPFLVSGGTIKLGCTVIGAKVLLGSAVKGLTDDSTMLIQDVPAGTHWLRVRKRGYKTWEQKIRVSVGQTLEIDAEMKALVVDGGAITAPLPDDSAGHRDRKDSRRGWQIAFWSGAALTVGAAVGMLVTGLSVLDLERDKDRAAKDLLENLDSRRQLSPAEELALQTGDACSGSSGVTAELNGICDDGKNRAVLFNVFTVAGAVTAMVSTYFLYKAYIAKPERSGPTDDGEEARRSSPWRVTSAVTPEGAHVGLSLSF